MIHNLGIELGHALIISSEDISILSYENIKSSFSEGDKLSLMKMGLGLASSPRFIWVTVVGSSRCSKSISQRVFKCLIQGSESYWTNSLDLKVSSLSSSKWLVDTMFTERLLKILSTLISESYDDVTDELSDRPLLQTRDRTRLA